MAIREDVVASAARFLQDPLVAGSPPENRVAFLKAKNLTPDEINAALARAGFEGAAPTGFPAQEQQLTSNGGPPPQSLPSSQHFGQNGPYGPPSAYPPYGWQPTAPQAVPRRDWRDWFIMATMVGGVSYGLYSITKRYIYPLVAPPTPDRLEQDKQAIDAQFERAFVLVEQLAKDTEALKAAEQERTEKLDTALAQLETAMAELKVASRRREDDTERLRDDVRSLKEALPRALDTQREATDGRLREVNSELKGLKVLIGQRMPVSGSTIASNANANANANTNGTSLRPSSYTASSETTAVPKAAAEPSTAQAASPATVSNSSSPVNGGGYVPPTGSLGKAAIPAWQRAMATQSAGAASSAPSVQSASGSA